MPTRTASAVWNGTLHDGEGALSLESGAYDGPYSFASRFADADTTNPEELLGAAEAGCYAMALALHLGEAGYDPQRVQAEAAVTLDADALEITGVELDVTGEVPGVDEAEFREHAADAAEGCPVSKALGGTDVDVDASLA
ncbi:OsmC family peroxiredoxin [Halobacterium yunchengense]|uniref:OsmC family peroxiredoxin n=1 Tax=Halobacterium yunchengense TaxID=3108497 RepID=UPI003009C103